jgi:putative oxidoreductase
MVSIIDRHFPNGPRSGFDRDGKNGARQVDEMATTPPARQTRRRWMWLINLLERGRSLAERIPYSLVALVARFAAASVFWRSGQTKVEGFMIKENTFYLFREEYMVPLLPPDVAAYLSTFAEHLFPVLLIIGLASRLSALALLFMTAVIQLFVYPDGWPEHILWVSSLFLIFARGPGAVSLDHLIWNRVHPVAATAH